MLAWPLAIVGIYNIYGSSWDILSPLVSGWMTVAHAGLRGCHLSLVADQPGHSSTESEAPGCHPCTQVPTSTLVYRQEPSAQRSTDLARSSEAHRAGVYDCPSWSDTCTCILSAFLADEVLEGPEQQDLVEKGELWVRRGCMGTLTTAVFLSSR